MSKTAVPVKAGSSRVWITEDGPHPERAPLFMAVAKFNDPSQSFGEETKIEAPSADRYNEFDEIGSTQGAVERAAFGIMGRYPLALSRLLRQARKRCRNDVYVLFGECRNPQDFTRGWEKILYLPKGKIGTWSGENFGAIASDEQNPANETAEMSSSEMYEIGQMSFSHIAVSEATREIRTINVCDFETCGDCGDSSDGCQRVLATMDGTGATPGTLPSLLFSGDSGVTWSTQDISTMFSGETVSDAACIGDNFVIVSNSSVSLHFTDVDQLFLDANNAWTEVITGFNAAGPPNAITSCNVNHTWIVGDGGYIYFAGNIELEVTVQDPGVATTQNLQDVHALDNEFVMAVGDLNAVVFTSNGGETWASVTGPNAGITLNTCWMWSEDVWFVGDATGNLWYTTNQGITWTEKVLPTGITEIDEIQFINDAEGYMVAREGTGAARVLRTITGGYEWYKLPEHRAGVTPAGDWFNDVAPCGPGLNTVFAAGLDDDGATGIIVKAEAALA